MDLNNAALLLRTSRSIKEEMEASQTIFGGYSESRVGLQNKLVIGRYACLPFYHELERDLALQNSRLINSYLDHQYIAQLDYAWDLEELTPKTWFKLEDVPQNTGPLIVKGRTNSKKFDWNNSMFAPDWKRAQEIALTLSEHDLLREQGLVFRQFEPLEVFEVGINGMPMSNEWRVFCFDGKPICHGYYWSILDDFTPVEAARADFEKNGLDCVRKALKKLAHPDSFMAIDVAKTASGRWIVIEINDGQQSGLSEIDPSAFYSSLHEALCSYEYTPNSMGKKLIC